MLEKSESEIMQDWKDSEQGPLASICTRTYNVKDFISECLDSLLEQQTSFSFEIVIDDDCSNDGTQDIIRTYEEKYPGIIRTNLREQNVGKEINFAENLCRARGKYIAICDGDDYWTDPLKLQKQVTFLEEDQSREYSVTYSKVLPLYDEGAEKRAISCPKRDCSAQALQKHAAGIVPSTACFRNIDAIKNYPVDYLFDRIIDDHFLWSLLGGEGKGKLIQDIQPVMYRQHAQGLFSTKTRHQRNMLNLQTDFMLYMYHKKNGHSDVSKYFLFQIIKYFIRVHGLNTYSGIYFAHMKETVVNRTKELLRPIVAQFFPEKFPCIKHRWATGRRG